MNGCVSNSLLEQMHFTPHCHTYSQVLLYITVALESESPSTAFHLSKEFIRFQNFKIIYTESFAIAITIIVSIAEYHTTQHFPIFLCYITKLHILHCFIRAYENENEYLHLSLQHSFLFKNLPIVDK